AAAPPKEWAVASRLASSPPDWAPEGTASAPDRRTGPRTTGGRRAGRAFPSTSDLSAGWRDRINAGGAKRMTPAEPTDSQPGPANHAMNADGLDRVDRARRLEPAGAADERR